MDRILLNPWVSKAGNATWLIGAIAFVYGVMSGWDPFVVIGVILVAIGVVLIAAPRIKKWRTGFPRLMLDANLIHYDEVDASDEDAAHMDVRVPVKVTNQEPTRPVSLEFRLLREYQGEFVPSRDQSGYPTLDLAAGRTGSVPLVFRFYNLKREDLFEDADPSIQHFRFDLWRLQVVDRVSGKENEINIPTGPGRDPSGYLAVWREEENDE
jgi:hypothetical protein